MSLTVVLPDLRSVRQAGFNPFAELALPGLAGLLGRADASTLANAQPEAWLRQQFGASHTSAAELARQLDMPAAPDGHWLRADPVHLRADRDRALLFDAALLGISQDEADQLVAALNQLYAADGLTFFAPTPQRWYLQLPAAPDCITSPLANVIGQDIHAHLPKGPSALRWHRLLNEWQMLLYSQPLNDVREQQGKPTINSLWLWGEGEPVGPLQSPFAQLLADDTLARSLAQAAGMPHQPLGAGYQLPQATTLVWLDRLSSPARQGDLHGWRDALLALDQQWFQPMLADWRAGRLDQLTLLLPAGTGTRQYALGRAARWKWWRRPASLTDQLLESA